MLSSMRSSARATSTIRLSRERRFWCGTMAHAFPNTDQLTSPWPLAGQLFAWASRTAGAALVRTVHWCRYPSGRVSVPPVSSEWLAEHETRSRKHPHDV